MPFFASKPDPRLDKHHSQKDKSFTWKILKNAIILEIVKQRRQRRQRRQRLKILSESVIEIEIEINVESEIEVDCEVEIESEIG